LDPQAALEAGETFNKVVQYLNRAVHHPAVQAFIMLYAVGAGSGPAATEESVATSAITTNAAKGAAFEQSVVKATESTDSNVVEQVNLKTQSGVKTRMDVVSTTESGKIRLQEAKSSATAPLTPNQAAAHPEIEQTGATVVGRGKPNYPGGTEIPPTQVEVVRPKNE